MIPRYTNYPNNQNIPIQSWVLGMRTVTVMWDLRSQQGGWGSTPSMMLWYVVGLVLNISNECDAFIFKGWVVQQKVEQLLYQLTFSDNSMQTSGPWKKSPTHANFWDGSNIIFTYGRMLQSGVKTYPKKYALFFRVILFLQNIKHVHQPKSTLNLHLECNC
jgi:hypothetical protein